MLGNTSDNYGSIAKLLHWLIFLLVLCMLIAGFLMDDIQEKAIKMQVINLHKLTGITILSLMIFRLFWSLINPKPALPEGTPFWQRKAERIVHGLIYLALIAMPLSGWIMSVAAGHDPHFFHYQLGLLGVPQNKTLSDGMFTVHSWLAYSIIGLVSIHVLAALYHYSIKKDNVLERMWIEK